jgi:hypothetical protein
MPYHRNGRLGRRLEVAHPTFDDKSGGQIGFGASKDFVTSAATPSAKATPRKGLHHSGREQEGGGPAVGHTQTGLAAFQVGFTIFGAMERERPQPRRDFPAAPLIGYHASCVQRSS